MSRSNSGQGSGAGPSQLQAGPELWPTFWERQYIYMIVQTRKTALPVMLPMCCAINFIYLSGAHCSILEEMESGGRS